MLHVPELAEVLVLLEETILWCLPRASTDDPRDCLRSEALRPSNLATTADKYGYFDYEWLSAEENQAVVSQVAAKRTELLRTEDAGKEEVRQPHMSGRLLIVAPQESDSSGLSEAETDSFLDVSDVPAWDTWVCYAHEPTNPEPEYVRRTQDAYRAWWGRPGSKGQSPLCVSYLLCWIPAPFIAGVEKGIQVNPMECIFWAADYKRHNYNTELLRRLNAAGLLL